MKILSEDRIPTDIPCRKDQKEIIEGFILNAISMTYSPEVLYIAGVPGIGNYLFEILREDHLREECYLKG